MVEIQANKVLSRVDASAKRQRLRDLMGQRDPVVLPGVFDGFSARLVEIFGWKGGNITGSGVANSRFAKPDVGIVGKGENVDAARTLCSSVDIPLFADGDTGYGNAVSTYVTMEEFESAGVSGIFFEDQEWPKRCGHMSGKRVIAASEMVEKIRAARDARRDPGLVLMARTDAAATHGIDEAIRRANLYLQSGAEMVFPDGLTSSDDIRRFVSSVDGPTCINMGFGIRSRATTPMNTVNELADMGVRMIFYPRMLTSAAIMGMIKALEAFREQCDTGTIVDRTDLCVDFETVEGLAGVNVTRGLEMRYVDGSDDA